MEEFKENLIKLILETFDRKKEESRNAKSIEEEERIIREREELHRILKTTIECK